MVKPPDAPATRSESSPRPSAAAPTPESAAFGSWRSPISAGAIARGATEIGAPLVCGDRLYFIEGRPAEGGRSVLMVREPSGEVAEVLPRDFDVGSRVYEYGGGAFAVLTADAGGPDRIAVSDAESGCLYLCHGRADERRELLCLTRADAGLRFGDLSFDAAHARLLCVRERHADDRAEPTHEVVAVSLGGEPEDGRVLVTGADFYASPRAHPEGHALAYISWDHPDMPWDATRAFVATLDPAGSVAKTTAIAGGPGESVLQPDWAPDGALHYVSDRSGWWNLYRVDPDDPAHHTPVHALAADFARPPWRLATRDYHFAADGRIVCRYTHEGLPTLAWLRPTGPGEAVRVPLERPFADFDCPIPFALHGETALVVLGSGPTSPQALVIADAHARPQEIVARSTTEPDWAESDISAPESIWFPAALARDADPPDEDAQTHAFFYPPKNAAYTGPPGERPPLIVVGHGGPTSATSPGLSLGIQFFTSRGFAVVCVDYGGSTGYGRAYRERLRGQWGVVDVADCVGALDFLAARGDVDPERAAIRGRSAGGYTTLCALTFTDRFRAGASHFGIGDLMALVRDTHKFESRYVDGLVGPLPESEPLYRERSPIHHVDRLRTPMILFQGDEDRVVPPGQADAMVRALDRKNLPVAYLRFAGEAHGFRKSETIERALEAELYFYGRIFGFRPADRIAPVEIRNLQ